MVEGMSGCQSSPVGEGMASRKGSRRMRFFSFRECNLLALGALVLGSAAPLWAKDWTHRLRFKRGHSTAVVEGGVIREDQDIYLVGARKGQTMRVHLTSLENNAAFTILQPRSRKALPGTEEGKDPTRWSGRLPRSGEYQIRVAPTRGNTGYKLKVTIR